MFNRSSPTNRSNRMAHVLARLKGVRVEDIRKVLEADAAQHAAQGLHLEHLWQNASDLDEVYFLFQTNDLSAAKQFIENTHIQAHKQDPSANLPEMKFLEEK